MDQNSSPIREFGSPILWFIAALFFVLAVLPVFDKKDAIPVNPEELKESQPEAKSLITE